MTKATTETSREAHDTRTITITVNDQPVPLTEHRVDGAQIKAAAIAAGVPIQADFVLSRVLPGGKQEITPTIRRSAFTRERHSGRSLVTTTPNLMAGLKQAVVTGVAEITAAYGTERVRVIADGQGWARVEISGLDPGPAYQQAETFLVCLPGRSQAERGADRFGQGGGGVRHASVAAPADEPVGSYQ